MKTNFHVKGFALGLALKQRRKATRKSPIYRKRYPRPSLPATFARVHRHHREPRFVAPP